jgi:hypothetical protein
MSILHISSLKQSLTQGINHFQDEQIKFDEGVLSFALKCKMDLVKYSEANIPIPVLQNLGIGAECIQTSMNRCAAFTAYRV